MASETSKDHLHLFKCQDNTIITTTGNIRQYHIEEYFDKHVKNKSFPERAKVIAICGYHGGDDGKVGKPFDEFNRQVRNALKSVKDKNKDICKSMEYILSGDVKSISNLTNFDVKSSLEELIEDTFETQSEARRPTVFLFASCFSDINQFKECLIESGITAISKIKNERGSITNGVCLKLDPTQLKLIEVFKAVHEAKHPDDMKIRNLFLTGSFGTGKTVVLTEICWMMINYLLRMLKEKQNIHGKSVFSRYKPKKMMKNMAL